MGKGQEGVKQMSKRNIRIPPSPIRSFSVFFFATLVAALAVNSEAASAEVSNCTVVILGASYAKSWPVPQIGEFSVVNMGIGGNQSFEMAERFHTDVANQNADAVILWGFINDIFRAPQDQLGAARKRILDSYSQMITLSTAAGITPVIATEVPIRGPAGFSNWLASIVGRLRGKTSYQSMINRHVLETNADLKKLASMHSVAVLDFYSVLSDEDGMRRYEFATEDGSHLSAAAYAELTEYVSETFPVTCLSSD
jgi:lysophospholipase L1-like esterase